MYVHAKVNVRKHMKTNLVGVPALSFASFTLPKLCVVCNNMLFRKRYELEKARLQLEAIARQTNSWHVTSNGHAHPIMTHEYDETLTDFTDVDAHLQTQGYEQPMNSVNTTNKHLHNTSSDESPWTAMRGKLPQTTEILSYSQSQTTLDVTRIPLSKSLLTQLQQRSCSVDSVRSVASTHSNHYSVSDVIKSYDDVTAPPPRATPPLMCSTPGSMRNEPLSGFSPSLVYDDELHSLCSTPASLRHAAHDLNTERVTSQNNNRHKPHDDYLPGYTPEMPKKPAVQFSTFKAPAENHVSSTSATTWHSKHSCAPMPSGGGDGGGEGVDTSAESLDTVILAFDDIDLNYIDTSLAPPVDFCDTPAAAVTSAPQDQCSLSSQDDVDGGGAKTQKLGAFYS